MRKRLLLMTAVFSVVLLLSGCGQKVDGGSQKPAQMGKYYSVPTSTVAGAAAPTTKLDLSLLEQKNLQIFSYCVLDKQNILLLCGEPLRYEENEEGNTPQKATFFKLNLGDYSLAELYSGELQSGQMQLLAGQEVAVLAFDTIYFFNYQRGQITGELPINDAWDVAVASDGTRIAYADQTTGDLLLVDRKGEVQKKITAAELGYNWLSVPQWSADGANLAFFAAYEQGMQDDILIYNFESGAGTTLDYASGSDIFPYWPQRGTKLAVLHNFFINMGDEAASIDAVDLKTGAAKDNLIVGGGSDAITLSYMDTDRKIYFTCLNGKLFFSANQAAPLQLSPPNLVAADDNVSIAPDASFACLLDTQTLQLYVMNV